jgi:hypothetical protein
LWYLRPITQRKCDIFQTVPAVAKDSARLRGLKRILSQKTIDRSIGEHLKTRYCKRIDNQQLVWLIVGMGLFPGKKYREIFRLFAAPWLLVPSSATITMARKRLSASVIEHLCSTVIKLLAINPQKHPFAFYKSLRLMGVDGTLLDCPNTDANRKAFGRTSNQTSHGAFPKARVVSLCELGTRVLWQNVIGTYHQSEEIADEKLPPRANRITPRKIKKRSKARPTKHDSDRLPPRPNGCFRDHVQMSI